VRAHGCEEASCRIARLAAVEGLNCGASIHDDADIAGRTEQQVHAKHVCIGKRCYAWRSIELGCERDLASGGVEPSPRTHQGCEGRRAVFLWGTSGITYPHGLTGRGSSALSVSLGIGPECNARARHGTVVKCGSCRKNMGPALGDSFCPFDPYCGCDHADERV
jgi:hypothetical protein